MNSQIRAFLLAISSAWDPLSSDNDVAYSCMLHSHEISLGYSIWNCSAHLSFYCYFFMYIFPYFGWIGNSSASCGVGWGTRIAWRSKRLQTYGRKLYLASRWQFSCCYWQGALVFLHVPLLYSYLGFLTVQGLSSKQEHSQRKEVEAVSLLKVWAQK